MSDTGANTLTAETDGVDVTASPSGGGCAECEVSDGWWIHLRRCAACGRVGCCDSSPSAHASAHFRETGHRYMQSFEPGESWFWDFEGEASFDGPELAEPTSKPAGAATPGPRGRVPQNWRDLMRQ